MKQKALFLLFALMIPWGAWAQTFTATTVEGVEMKFSVTNSTTKECRVYGTSSTPSIPRNYSGVITIPEEANGYKVTSIGSYAFDNCSSLTSVSIPEGVTSIGISAFQNCRGLTSVNIPDSVSFICPDAFDGCDAIAIYITNLEAWCYIFDDYYVNPSPSPHHYSYHLFLNGEEIHDLVIPDGVTSIGNNAFDGCIGLNSISLPNSITHIGRYAFGDCPNIVIPCSSVPELDFWYTDYWTQEICVDAFSTDCKIYVPASLLEKYNYTWGLIANQIYAIEGETDYDITVHAQEQTSNIITVVGEEHLSHIISLKLTGTINSYDIQAIRERMPLLRHLDLSDVDIVANSYPYYTDENGISYHSENGVLGDWCFANMADLQDIQLPKHIQEIGRYAFYGCETLRIIKIPKGTVSIGNYAFDGCNLNNVVVYDSEPAQIFSSTFPNRTNIYLSVLEGSKEKYMSASFWKDFKGLIDSTDIIHFADENVEKICVSKWDANGDEVISMAEATNVKSIANIVPFGLVSAYDSPFLETDITSFDELKYFTGLTKIPGWTFYDCKNLSSIIIPENVVSIGGGSSAFGPCEGHQEAGAVTWKRRQELGAFNGCSNLVSVTIPESLKSIDQFAFLGCDNLKEVHISNLQSWTDIDLVDWSANPLSYAHHLLLDNQEVTTINFPDGVDKVKKYVFSGCQGLTSVSFPNTVTSIGEGAFKGCTNLPSITIPENLTSIGKYAFQNCSSISTLQILNGITELPAGVFAGCSQLSSIEIPPSVIKIGGYYFEEELGCGFVICYVKDGPGAFEDCSSLTSIIIPEGVTSIGPNTFRSCTNLSSVNIPESVTQIENGAFEGCSNLKSIHLPNDFKTIYVIPYDWPEDEDDWPEDEGRIYGIGNRLFYGCSSLTSITLPECVDSIGEDAFYGCDNLTFVKVKRQTPISIDENTFPTRANIPLYVPMGSGDLYRAANYWKDFKQIIEVENIDDYVEGEIFTVPVDLDNGNEVLMTFKVIDATNKTVQVGVGDSASIVASTVGGIIIPNKVNDYTVTKIGSYAFYYCSNLTSVSIPNTVKTIGDHAFYVCSGLTSLHISANVTSIEDRAFAYCSGLESIVVDDGNTVYDSRDNCNALIKTSNNTLLIGCKNTAIPSTVKIIAEGAFRGCAELISLEIPEGVTTIGSGAFRGCTGLESVTLPSTITSIGTYAFSAFDEVYNLTTVTVGMTTPVTITSNVFPNRANSTLYVPKGTKELYKAANYWKEFKEIIEIGEDDSNRLYAQDITARMGAQVSIPVVLVNEKEFGGLQFILTLPEGVTLSGVEKTERLDNSFQVAYDKVSDNTYQVILFNMSRKSFLGNDGELLSLRVSLGDDMDEGDYEILLSEVVASDFDLNESSLPDSRSTLTVEDFLLGDATLDGRVNVTDVMAVVNCILGHEMSVFSRKAADINADNKINITDVMGIVNIILTAGSNSLQ